MAKRNRNEKKIDKAKSVGVLGKEKTGDLYKSGNDARKHRKILVVIDLQNDFITGPLGNSDSVEVESKIVKLLLNKGDQYDAIYFTKDMHYDNYLNTLEGQKLPTPHCIFGTEGVKLTKKIGECMTNFRKNKKYVKVINKHTFGSSTLQTMLAVTCSNEDEIEFVGVYTDICVVSNALMCRQAMPNISIKVNADCCAGTSKENHEAALKVMKSCQIDIISGDDH